MRDSVKCGKTGFLVPYKDIEALAEAIVWLLTDHKTRKRVSKEARREALKFTWGRTVVIIYNFLKRLL